MNAEILAVGTELLMGQIANTNAQYISQKLNEIGVNVYYHSVVGDNSLRLKQSLNLALSRSDIVIMTGGLGPTQDDLTKETVAKAFNKEMKVDQKSLDLIRGFFKKINREMTPNNEKQAYFPEGSKILYNSNGTAPGCIVNNGEKTIVMLPGPPSEMRPMLDEGVIPHLLLNSPYKIFSRYLRIFGIGESQVENELLDLIDKQDKVTIATYAKVGEVTIRLTARSENIEDAQSAILPVEEEIIKRMKGAVYSTENKELEEVVGELLISKDITIALAESCTGGIISSKLTSVPGISRVLNRGIISYSNQSKIENLGVKKETLDSKGAVSRETAIEMAEGIRKIAGTKLGLSVTGIAGPDGGSEEKPVGLVYVAVAGDGGTHCIELRLWGDRNKIRNYTSLHALDAVRRYVIKEYQESGLS